MEMTKGFLKLEGHIWFLNNKKAYENGSVRSLSFGLQTSKDNTIFIQVGEWKNTPLKLKLKSHDMTEVEEIGEQDSINRIAELFKDGDSVFVNLRSEIDTYNGKLKYLVNQIYVKSEPINLDSENFVEVNELNTPVVITELAKNRLVKVGMVSFRGEMLEQELSLSDNDVNDYFTENVKVGDLVKVSISVNRKPNYVDGEVAGVEPARKTLKGKSVSTGGKRQIDGYIESLEVTDVDIDKIEKRKYEKKEIREALEGSQPKQAATKKEDITPIQTEDLPF